MDPLSIGLMIGLISLFIERLFDYAKRIKKSECFSCCDIEMKPD